MPRFAPVISTTAMNSSRSCYGFSGRWIGTGVSLGRGSCMMGGPVSRPAKVEMEPSPSWLRLSVAGARQARSKAANPALQSTRLVDEPVHRSAVANGIHNAVEFALQWRGFDFFVDVEN